MSFIGNRLSICLVLFAFFICSASMSANNPSTKKKKTKRKSTLTAKTIKVEQSPDKCIALTMNNGEQVSLPKVEKVFDEKPLSIASFTNLLNKEETSPSLLKEKLAEQKEITNLSEKLGIEIFDATYLDLYREVANWIGTRYRRGGMSQKAVDCSGFTNLIYNNVFAKKLPRVSTEIAKNVTESLSKDDLKPGDLVFFSTFGKKYINHVGVYLGGGNFAHASIKKGVVVSTLTEGYYSKAWRKGGRM